MTERKKRIIDSLRTAVEYCGYDWEVVMNKHSRGLVYCDLRAIVWSIYREQTEQPFQRIALDFGRDRVTIFSAVDRAKRFRKVDRNFADMYDSVYGAFLNAYSIIGEEKKEEGNEQV